MYFEIKKSIKKNCRSFIFWTQWWLYVSNNNVINFKSGNNLYAISNKEMETLFSSLNIIKIEHIIIVYIIYYALSMPEEIEN